MFKGFFFLSLIVFTSILLTACSNPQDTSAPSGIISIRSATKGILTTLENLMLEDEKARRFFQNTADKTQISSPEKIRLALARHPNIIGIKKEKIFQQLSPGVAPCESGEIRIEQNVVASDFDKSFTKTFNDCLETVSGKTILKKGVIREEFGANKMTKHFLNFSIEETDPRTKRVETRTVDGTTTFLDVPESVITCGDNTIFTDRTITSDVSERLQIDIRGDDILESDEVFTTNNWGMTIAETFSPEPACTFQSSEIAINGSTWEEDLLVPSRNFNVNFTNFLLSLTADEIIIDGSPGTTEGTWVTFRGVASINSECALGTYTVSTPEGSELFFPNGKQCAVLGGFLVSKPGGIDAVLTTSKGGIRINEGNDETVEHEFTSCSTALVC